MSQRRPFPWTASMHDYWEKSPCLSDQQDRSQVVGGPLLTAQQDPHICRDPEQQPGISEMPQNTPELSLSTMSRTTGPAALLICQFKKKPKTTKNMKTNQKARNCLVPAPPTQSRAGESQPHQISGCCYGIFAQASLSAQEEHGYDTRGSTGDQRNLPR